MSKMGPDRQPTPRACCALARLTPTCLLPTRMKDLIPHHSRNLTKSASYSPYCGPLQLTHTCRKRITERNQLSPRCEARKVSVDSKLSKAFSLSKGKEGWVPFCTLLFSNVWMGQSKEEMPFSIVHEKKSFRPYPCSIPISSTNPFWVISMTWRSYEHDMR